ncbi:hypothetical protein D7D52_34465 [Nocardia yunnanensis]|uniref:Uncharacterized protein n=1 Tax=Nocardia yunnanensis TaxID=2382165 RepID=A0A386ZLC3_9NOCA|nr:hypothetical protein [Nocardia yunnanensis]AYF78083.1 hypothetical protein D7D52_34465 [Nocardia yunnanensis]
MTTFAQLLCGWAMVNLESSGTGVGVVARSGNWPPALGSTTRELGSLVSWEGAPAAADALALEFTLTRGLAVAVLKTPSNARPGTCVAHLVAGERGTLDGATALSLYDSGLFRTSVEDPGYPTDRWDAVPDSFGHNASLAAAADAYLDLDWLPALLGYTLAHLAGRGPGVQLRVEHGTDALAMLRALYGILPRNTLRALTFCTTATPSADCAIVTVTRDSKDAPTGERRIVTPGDRGDESDPFVQLGRQIVGHRQAGATLPESLGTAQEIGIWCYRRHLRALGPDELDDDHLAEVIGDPELNADWFQDPAVAARAVRLAIGNPSVARSLAGLELRPGVRETFEKVLIDRVMNDTRDRTRLLEVARQLGVDLTEALVTAARRRLESGHGQLTAADAAVVWPSVHTDWITGSPKRRQVVAGYLSRHRALREHAIGARDRALVHRALRVEVDDHGVPTGSSHLLRTAMYANLGIVAQVAVDVACDGRDRYALEQILTCAPPDRLSALIAECVRYPALDARDLMKALTLSRSDPAELVAALTPAWRELRRSLGLPEPIEALVVLDADDSVTDEIPRGRLSRKGFGRRNGRDWSTTDLSALLRSPDEPIDVDEARETLSAALHSDLEYVVTRLVSRTKSPDGAAVLQRVLAVVSPEQLPGLVTACARQWDMTPATLLPALAALDLEPAELADTLAGGWPWVRTRLDLPPAIAALLALDAAAARPWAAREPETRRGWQFWR